MVVNGKGGVCSVAGLLIFWQVDFSRRPRLRTRCGDDGGKVGGDAGRGWLSPQPNLLKVCRENKPMKFWQNTICTRTWKSLREYNVTVRIIMKNHFHDVSFMMR